VPGGLCPPSVIFQPLCGPQPWNQSRRAQKPSESAEVRRLSIGLVILRIFLALIDAKRPFKETTTVRRLPSKLRLTVSIRVYFYRRSLHSLHLDRPLVANSPRIIDHGHDGIQTSLMCTITPSRYLNGRLDESDRVLNYAPRANPSILQGAIGHAHKIWGDSSYFPRIKDPVILSYERFEQCTSCYWCWTIVMLVSPKFKFEINPFCCQFRCTYVYQKL